MNKPCERCHKPGRIQGERFCQHCRKAVLAWVRSRCRDDDLPHTRTIYSRNAEALGRSQRAPNPGSEIDRLIGE